MLLLQLEVARLPKIANSSRPATPLTLLLDYIFVDMFISATRYAVVVVIVTYASIISYAAADAAMLSRCRRRFSLDADYDGRSLIFALRMRAQSARL